MKNLMLILLAVGGCATAQKPDRTSMECMSIQLDAFSDICAEASTGYEDMKGQDAYWEGAKCAIEAAMECARQNGWE